MIDGLPYLKLPKIGNIWFVLPKGKTFADLQPQGGIHKIFHCDQDEQPVPGIPADGNGDRPPGSPGGHPCRRGHFC